MIFSKLSRPDKESLSGLGGSLLVHWALAGPDWVISFTVSTLSRLLPDSPGAFLVIGVLLTSTSITTGLMSADPGHMV